MSSNLQLFLKEIQHSSYAEKYRRWEEYLTMESHSESYIVLLDLFLQTFPFNYKYWIEYIQQTSFEDYKTALKHNPKSYELWIQYITNLKLMDNNQKKYQQELQYAIIQIGADSRSLFLFEEYYENVGENSRYDFFKKIFTRGLIDLERMYDRFKEWFGNLNETQIKGMAIKQFKNLANSMSVQEQRQNLRQSINSIYSKTITYRNARVKLQDKIKHPYFDGSPQIQQQKEIWKQLIKLSRQNGVVQNISYCYQRSLMALTDDIDNWEEAFHYMENQTNKYNRVLSILRNNKKFFLKFDVNLYFYWCDLEQRDIPNNARNMYQQIAGLKPTYQIYKRWIQFQIRDKKLDNAKSLYDTLVTNYQKDIEILSYILVQYSQFIIKYYKDFQLAKKFLKAYIDHLPFNQYLCLKYLQLMKIFQNKEGYYEELMKTIYDSISKANKTLNHSEKGSFIKTLKYYLRSALTSIYLIKISQQKMLEVQQKYNKAQELSINE